MKYYCCIQKEDGLYGVRFPDIPNIITVGSSIEHALEMAADALNGTLESDLARGQMLPETRIGPGPGLYPIDLAPHIEIAWELRKLRGQRTQTEIAQILGLTYQAYQRLENPRKGNPTIKTLERILKAFGKNLELHIA